MFLLLGIEAIRNYKTNPHLVVGTHHVPTWTSLLVLALVVSALVPSTSLLGHLCGLGVGYLCKCFVCPTRLQGYALTTREVGLGYLKVLMPPERILRFIESKLNLLVRLPHYVSVDQKTYGRFGVLPSANASVPSIPLNSGQRLGP